MDQDIPQGQPQQPVHCPSCLQELHLDERQLFLSDPETNNMVPWDPGSEPNRMRRQDQLNRAFLKCPNDQPDRHFLPVPYLMFGKPMTIAFVGQSGTGKTHLLAAIMAEIGRGGLDSLGIRCRSVNTSQHHEFLARAVNQLEAGRVLPATRPTDFVEFTDALLITVNGQTRPVAFFDIAGESLHLPGKATEFLLGVDALVFVVDALRALRLKQLSLAREVAGVQPHTAGLADPTFSAVLDRLPRDGGLCDVPTVIVLNKCDVLRFEPPIDQWLREDGRPKSAPDPNEVYRESQDVFAFLTHYQATPWLRPFMECRRCTLHFVSATGMSPAVAPAVNGGSPASGSPTAFVGGIRPRRVLGPLLSVFQMWGLLDTPVSAPRLREV
ncbi:ATP-binding protein [Streptomyces sp. FZ201]|uniref:ATP-binding protein n=1 Tax=Streptomyces sp. FZ201 TaxID=3057122 RepID=UPI0021C1173B|nr:ATP-binding protein [Streptomyces sp. FZ201]